MNISNAANTIYMGNNAKQINMTTMEQYLVLCNTKNQAIFSTYIDIRVKCLKIKPSSFEMRLQGSGKHRLKTPTSMVVLDVLPRCCLVNTTRCNTDKTFLLEGNDTRDIRVQGTRH